MDKKTVILSGNPNVGKSSVFNFLTGMHQHTGNWSGKTVSKSEGVCKFDKNITLIDLPGTYSLMHLSEEELIARDVIAFGKYYKNIIVCDACLLERNLNLVLQIIEANKNVLICLNQMDVARKKNISIDKEKLEEILGVKVILCSAKTKDGIKDILSGLKEEVRSDFYINYGKLEEKIKKLSKLIDDFKLNLNSRFIAIRLLEGDKNIVKSINEIFKVNILTEEINLLLRDENFNNNNDIVSYKINKEAERIYNEVTTVSKYKDKTLIFDKIITKKCYGIPFSCLLLALVFYITIVFANYPSDFLSNMFSYFGNKLNELCILLNIPDFIYKPIVDGVYGTLTWVISVMLPPMAIFFPLFALGEESGLFPRIAFNFDKIFRKCRAHGKQVLTMAMGFGCNACAIVGSRIIDSPRDKLVAILTNNFVPCNGRFPLLIALTGIFFVSSSSILTTIVLVGLILCGVLMSLLVSKLLSLTVLKGIPSHFSLELPSYKKPKIASVIIRSIFDKTLFVLARAIKVAAPAGLLIYFLANVHVSDVSLLKHISDFLDPFANLLGLDGIILFAFILALPANEIVLPIIIMGYLGTGNMVDVSSLSSLKELLVNNGWSIMTALSVCLFSIMHFPCATTLLTIKKECGFKWMVYAFIIPTFIGMLVLFLINCIYKLLIS